MPWNICNAKYFKRGVFSTKYLILVELSSSSLYLLQLSGTVQYCCILLSGQKFVDHFLWTNLTKSFLNSYLLKIQREKVEKGMSWTEEFLCERLGDTYLSFDAWTHQGGEH